MHNNLPPVGEAIEHLYLVSSLLCSNNWQRYIDSDESATAKQLLKRMSSCTEHLIPAQSAEKGIATVSVLVGQQFFHTAERLAEHHGVEIPAERQQLSITGEELSLAELSQAFPSGHANRINQRLSHENETAHSGITCFPERRANAAISEYIDQRLSAN